LDNRGKGQGKIIRCNNGEFHSHRSLNVLALRRAGEPRSKEETSCEGPKGEEEARILKSLEKGNLKKVRREGSTLNVESGRKASEKS